MNIQLQVDLIDQKGINYIMKKVLKNKKKNKNYCD